MNVNAASVQSTVACINGLRSSNYRLMAMIALVRAALFSLLISSIWQLLEAGDDIDQLIVLATTLIVVAVTSWPSRRPRLNNEELLMALEVSHNQTTTAPFSMLNAEPTTAQLVEWDQPLRRAIDSCREHERWRLRRDLSTTALPLLLLLLLSVSAPLAVTQAWSGARGVVSRLSWGARLEVVDGLAQENQPKSYKLSSSSPANIELLAQNMVRIEALGAPNEKHIVELRRLSQESGDEILQSFQMTPEDSSSDPHEPTRAFGISFVVSEDVSITLPAVGGGEPVARVKVRQLPIPKVRLAIAEPQMRDPWPDDKPLRLKMNVKAENPLQLVRLIISAGGKPSSEVVSNVMSDDKFELALDYSVILEPYLEADLAEVEIFAEAIDRAIPQPLIGRSEGIRLTSASAYGRYRQTLDALRKLKTSVDSAITEKKSALDDNAVQLAEEAIARSDDSPFFDGLDRVGLHQFRQSVREIVAKNVEGDQLLQLSGELNEFLFEHEILDDKERDRDFFVAIRGLSRLIEQSRTTRPVQVRSVTKRISQFLDERHKRWTLRTERLGSDRLPASWPRISKRRPFHEVLNAVDANDVKASQDADDNSLQQLSKVAVAYREWIEELEKAEEQDRQEQEEKRQEGLANARNVLKELQKRQGQVSSQLDRAAQRPASELAQQWAMTRMEQNTNIRGTKQLEAQLRALSPLASERIKVAAEFMEGTLQSGNEGKFVDAESGSDRAGRLLRQADSAASQSQQQQRSRGRRRRVSGDGYYGQSVIGGDVEIKRDYEVDRRYREDVLEDVRQSTWQQSEPENKALLENYLLEIIR